jgi:hypothetical protein
MLMWAENGWFLAREAKGGATLDPVNTDDTGAISSVYPLPGVGMLIRAEDGGWFVAHEAKANGSATVEAARDIVDTGIVSVVQPLPGVGVLIGAENGWFLVRGAKGEEKGVVKVDRAGTADTGSVYFAGDLPRVGALIGAEKGLFLAREENGAGEEKGVVRVEPFRTENIGTVFGVHDLPEAGALIEAQKGWFLAPNGVAMLEPAGTADTGFVFAVHDLPGAGVLIGALKGLFLARRAPLSGATVDLLHRSELDGSRADPTRPRQVVFTMAHDCANVADKLDLQLRVTPQLALAVPTPSVNPGPAQAKVTVPLHIDTAGDRSFQLVSTFGGREEPVGEPQHLSFDEPEGWLPWFKRWGLWGGEVVIVLAGLGNLALFVLAPYYPWAWRMATDDGLIITGVRVATLALSYVPICQIWILDLYFRRTRDALDPMARFRPLPLTTGKGTPEESDCVLTPPWTGRRLWIQGNSGMGKTALFRHHTEAHFRDYKTAFAAFDRWGCIVVAFAARDFAGSTEDKDDDAWVVDAVRATLSSQGMTFADDKLLRRFLASGTIAVAIDGLNEVSRTRAVTAFTRSFEKAPMLVTSQEPGGERFTTWRLPADIRAYTEDLLRAYLDDAAVAVMTRISASGLKDAICSGYDVRLVIDLAQSDPHGAALPADRLGLYATVVSAGWPEATEEVRREQQNRLEAAAWQMVSERKPHEDMRRLKPDVDLAAELLVALADAPEKNHRPVRLLHRAANGFEFVHDQMHAYLAARWFAQDELPVAELERKIAASTIWMHAAEAQRTLWGFAAALLDDERLIALRARVEDKEEWDLLRRALKAEADRRSWSGPTRERPRRSPAVHTSKPPAQDVAGSRLESKDAVRGGR